MTADQALGITTSYNSTSVSSTAQVPNITKEDNNELGSDSYNVTDTNNIAIEHEGSIPIDKGMYPLSALPVNDKD